MQDLNIGFGISVGKGDLDAMLKTLNRADMIVDKIQKTLTYDPLTHKVTGSKYRVSGRTSNLDEFRRAIGDEKYETTTYTKNLKKQRDDAEQLARNKEAAEKKFHRAKLRLDVAAEKITQLGLKEQTKEYEAAKKEQEKAEKNLFNQKVRLWKAAVKTGKQEEERLISESKIQREKLYKFVQYLNKKESADHHKENDKILSDMEARIKEGNKWFNSIQKEIKETHRIENSMHHAGITNTRKHANGYEAMLQKVGKVHHQMWLLNRLAHMAGFIWAFDLATRAVERYIHAVKESLHFIDDLNKTKILFTGFATANLNKTFAQIERDAIPKELEQLAKAKGISEDLTNLARITSMQTGSTMAATASIFKTIIPQLMRNYKGDTNALIDPKTRGPIVDLLKNSAIYASILQSIDQNRRNIQFYAVAVAKMFAGGQEGSQAYRQDFIPLFRRTELSFGKTIEKGIFNAVQQADYKRAMDLMILGFSKSAGLNKNKIDDLMRGTLTKPIDAIRSHLTYMFAVFNTPLAQALMDYAQKLSVYLEELSRNTKFMAFLKKLGEEQAKLFTILGDKFINMLRYFETTRGQSALMNWLSIFKQMFVVVGAIGQVVASFAKGLFGIEDTEKKQKENTTSMLENLKAMVEVANKMQEPAKKIGTAINIIANAIVALAAATEIIERGFERVFNNPVIALITKHIPELLGKLSAETQIEFVKKMDQIIKNPQPFTNSTIPFYDPNKVTIVDPSKLPKTQNYDFQGASERGMTLYVSGNLVVNANDPQQLTNSLNAITGSK